MINQTLQTFPQELTYKSWLAAHEVRYYRNNKLLGIAKYRDGLYTYSDSTGFSRTVNSIKLLNLILEDRYYKFVTARTARGVAIPAI